MKVIEFLLDAIAILLMIPVSVIFVQVAAAFFFPKRPANILPATKARIAVLVPAHNEAEGIAATINSILPQLKSGDRLLVIADNCSDSTASIATELGAEVIERQDPKNRGKGFALSSGIHFLGQNPPDIVVVVDADCDLQDGSLDKLAAYAAHHNRPTQCVDLMLSPAGSSLRIRIAEFAWIIKNLVRPLGYASLGLPCQLMGTGMAIPWVAIANIDLAHGNIVEDMKLGIDLCKSGNAPLFFSDALVTSYFPVTPEAQAAQRTRWEHGHLNMIFSDLPQLFSQSIMKGNKDFLAMALDLCVPPLSLLVTVVSGFLVLAGFAYAMDISTLPLLISGGSALALTLSILLAWWGWARHVISLGTFFLIPIYVISKIPYYLKFLFKRQKQWVSTDRKK